MFARPSRLVWIYFRLQLLHLRSQLEYEADFWVGLVGAAMRHVAGFLFIWAVFRQVPQVHGWTLWELLFLYALAIVPMGLVELFYDGPWRLSELINEGRLDRVLLRPLPAGLQVVTEASSLHGLGSVVLGLVLLVRAGSELQLTLAPWQYAFVAACMVGSVLLVGSLFFITQCLAFWEPSTTMSLCTLVQEMTALARFPVTLYEQLFRVLLTWVLPFAFISYFPGLVLLGRPEANPWLGYGSPLAGVVVTFVAARVWGFSLKHYQGAGS
ncbi:ABC-2 family transporter protein [Archangium violaceum]|uniref:ABC transporter permease n=1 Tax=Archangium violaceum TaxID=83451 RepID=UPI002B293066|nr:ABC-2 family transporter protein [Archangium gephyra]